MDKVIFKAALFDLDGVVFDTEPQYSVFWGATCRRYHPEIPGLENMIKGQTLVQIFDRFFEGMDEAKKEIKRGLDEFEANMSYDFISGFRPFVDSLHENGVRTAVVTSSNDAKMQCVYRAWPDFSTLFDAILTSEDFSESKPSPDCYLKAAARLGAKVEECIVFEDSFNGLKSGRAAHMAVVGLATTNPAEAISPLCDMVIDDYKDFGFEQCRQLLGTTR